MPEPGSLFDLVAKTFPSGFRAHHGQEMKHAFLSAAESVREKQGRLAAFQYSVRALGDALRNGLRERRRERRSGRFSPGPGPVGFQRTPLPGGSGVLSELGSDLRYSLRRLAHAPGFTLAAIVVLAFGIGANSTIFSALKTAILAEPPYPEPERLVLPAVVSAGRVDPGIRLDSWSYPKYQLLEAFPNRLIDPVAAYSLARPTLIGAGDPIRVDAEVVSPDYFRLLGASALVGRTFAPDENDPNAPPLVAVLGHGLWQTRFGRNPSAIGRQISIDGHSVTVVGVMPRGFKGLTGFGEIWIPIAATGHLMGEWRIVGPEAHWFHVLGRIPPEVRIEDAQAQMSMVAEAVEETHLDPDGNRYEYAGELMPLRAAAVNEVARTSILVLAAAAALVLLIACANLAGLLLARAGERRRETAVRIAMGAERWRVVRQHLTESLLLALGGGAVGLGLAHWGIDALTLMAPEALITGSGRLQFLNMADLGLDAGVVCFTVGLTLVTSVLFGLVPALMTSDPNLLENLKEGAGATATGGRSRERFHSRSVLVSAQIALAMILLVGAGLMIGSLVRLQRVETGIQPENLLVFSYAVPRSDPIPLPWLRPSEIEDDPTELHLTFMERIRSIPGVRNATIGCPPLGGLCVQTRVREIEGRPPFPRTERPLINADVVEESYFETLGAQVVRGRAFSATDQRGGPPVVILNESAARGLFPGEDALGRRIAAGYGATPEGEMAEIVGIVADILHESPDVGVQPVIYSPLSQVPVASATAIVQTEGDPFSVVPAIRSELGRLDPNLPIYRITTVETLGVLATGPARMIMELLSLFAAVAIVLAAVGVYSVVAYAVSLRNREIGLRMALGARSGQVLGLVLRKGVAAAGLGTAVGLVGAWGVTRVLSSFLYGVTATDPITYALGALVLFAAAVLASYLPARRATRLDPMEVLRTD